MWETKYSEELPLHRAIKEGDVWKPLKRKVMWGSHQGRGDVGETKYSEERAHARTEPSRKVIVGKPLM